MSAPFEAARRVHDLTIDELIDLATDCWVRGDLFNAAHFLRTAADRPEKRGREERALDALIARVTSK